jgi:hypothetical protein
MSHHNSTASALSDYQKVPTFIQDNSHILSEGRLRWWLRHRHKNGLIACGAVVEVEGNLYVNVPKFVAWFQAGGRVPSEAA